MAIYKRGKYYWYDFYFRGDRNQGSTRQSNKEAAKNIESARRTILANAEVGILERKPVPRFHDAMDAFLRWSREEHKAHRRTYQRYVISSKPLLRHFKDLPLDRITPGDVEQFKSARACERSPRTHRVLRPATVNRELACLKAHLGDQTNSTSQQ